jgi:hypothetical protein
MKTYGYCRASFTSVRDVKQEEDYCELVTDFINLIWHLLVTFREDKVLMIPEAMVRLV